MRSLVLVLGVLLTGYVVLTALLAYSQRSLLYYPQPVDPALAARFRAAEVRIKVTDATLRGWFLRHPDPAAPVVIYFGGNGDEASRYLTRFSTLRCCAALLVNYRGYGNSSGKPTEAALRSDALAAYDAAQRFRTAPGPTILFGRSLGTGMAVYAAAARPGTPLVLVSPYDSIAEVAAAAFPLFPARWLLVDKFDCLQYAAMITSPVTVFVAERDVVIERARSEALVSALKGNSQSRVVPRTDHNTILVPGDVWNHIDRLAAGLH